MKKYIFLLSVVLSFLGCEKEMMDYEGKDGIYFSVQEVPPSLYGNPEIWAHVDTTLIPFSLLLENDSTVRLKVRVMGKVKISGSGTHKELLESHPLYEEMIKQQFVEKEGGA